VRHLPLSIVMLVVAIAMAVAGCASTAPPRIEIVEVLKPVPVPCAADPGPKPDYADTDAALAAAPNVFAGVQLLKAGRLQRQARERQLEAALAGCAVAPKPPP